MPMLNVAYPSNSQLVCQTIIDLVNFKLIDTDKLFDKIFTFSNRTSLKLNQQFENSGIKSNNIIRNLGNFLLAFVAIAIIILLLVLIWLLAKKI
jgi:CHASE3 domain sensor protein